MSIFWSVFFVAALAVIYVAFVRPEIARFKAISGLPARIESDEASLKGRIVRSFVGIKTVVLGAVGVLTSSLGLLPPDILPGLHDVTWSAFVSEGTALKITSVLMITMIVTHAVGLRRAAEIVPKTGA